MIMDARVYSLRFNLQGIRDEENENFVDPSTKQISIPNNDQIEISQVHYCNGLLLCIAKDNSRLFVWNPYLGQTKSIQPRNEFHEYDMFALGYDKNRNHKILRFLYEENQDDPRNNIDVYDFNSDSWRVLVLDVNPDCDDLFYHSGVSLKGNTYFFGQEVITEEAVGMPEFEELIDIKDYLLCFDFTTESFGSRLPLPFNHPYPCFVNLTLSWVRDEKLAVFYNDDGSLITKIWISTKIEPNAISWSIYLTLDMTLINGLPDDFWNSFRARRFFIDEERKIAVLFYINRYRLPSLEMMDTSNLSTLEKFRIPCGNMANLCTLLMFQL